MADGQLFRKNRPSSLELVPARRSFTDYDGGREEQALQAAMFERQFDDLWRQADRVPPTIIRQVV